MSKKSKKSTKSKKDNAVVGSLVPFTNSTPEAPDEITATKKGLSPKQQMFLNGYLTPGSATFGNAYRSALAAGYSESYAINILTKAEHWLTENVDRQALSEDHIINGIQSIALDPMAKDTDRLKAFDMLAKIRGMMVQRKQQVNLTVEHLVD